MGSRRLWALVLGLPPYSSLARAVQKLQPNASVSDIGPRKQSTPEEIRRVMGDRIKVVK